jgi:membrane-bound lytic murein transglycosylase D
VRKIMIRLIIIMMGCLFVNMPLFAFSSVEIEGIRIYQKNTTLTPEHKRKLADDIARYQNADNLWDVLREEFTLPHYEDNPAVQEKIEWYMNNQDYLLRSANRAAPYLYYILQQVKKHHLPAELVLLPIIESGYNPFSLSTVGAAGIWQLMPATATGLGVRQDWWYDGRRDVITSTHAALNFLAYLENIYEGNWLLAFAAYDTGEGNVHAAMLKNIRNGRDTDFWSLPVATETKNYVPSLLALATIISHPEQYPVYFPPVRNAPYLAQVDVGMQINLKYAALLAGISHKNLMQLNPGYSRPSTPSKGPFNLLLPIEKVAQFTENFIRSPLNLYKAKVNIKDEIVIAKNIKPDQTIIANIKNSLAKKYTLHPGDTIYMVRLNDTFESIAQRFHLDVTTLRSANINNKKLIAGIQIIIPTHSNGDDSVQPGDTIYMVRRGDTIEDIAYKFHSSPGAIRLANLLDTNSLQEGERLVVPTHIQG